MDASSEDYGAIFMGYDKILTMFSCGSSKSYEHSATSEMDGLVRAIRAVRSYLLGEPFVVYSDNWSVLRAMHGTHASPPVLSRLEEITSWHSKIRFMEGKANNIADWLSCFPLVQTGKRKMKILEIQVESMALLTKQMDLGGDEYLQAVEQWLKIGVLPSDLGSDDRVVVKRSTWQFVIQEDKLCHK